MKLIRRKDYESLVLKMQMIQVDPGLHTQRRPREGRLGGGMDSWQSYLERGISPILPKDPIGGQERNHLYIKEDLQNLQPFVVKRGKKGLLGIALIILSAVLSFSQPLIHRHLIWL
jgi:hypothetical protein